MKNPLYYDKFKSQIINITEKTEENDISLKAQNFLLKKLRSPYNNFNYRIKNNDTIINVLKEFDIVTLFLPTAFAISLWDIPNLEFNTA